MTEPGIVLVVDDTPTKRYILSSWLRRAGHEVIEAGGGEEALQTLTAHHVDLIVLDVRLPDIPGYEVCERIKADPATSAIPVIQVSANAISVRERAEGLERGADAYLAEPIEPAEFAATVEAMLRYYRARWRAELMAERLAGLADVTLRMNEAESFDALLSVAVEGSAKVLGRFCGTLALLPDGRTRRFRARPGEVATAHNAAPGLLDRLGRLVEREAARTHVFTLDAEDWRGLLPDVQIEGSSTGVLCRTKNARAPIYLGVEARPALDADEVNLLRQLGQQLALAVDALRAYTEEHAIALTLQRSLLPTRIPEVPGLRVALRYQPAVDNIEVGGDFYEVLPIGDRVLVAIGDVEGHSLHAATVMAELRHAMRASFIMQMDLSASLDLLNRMMRRYHPRMTATLCLMLIDPATGEVEVGNAGHIPPLFAGPGSAYHSLGNLLLGALPEDYQVDRLKLPPGGTMLLFTDGLVEDRHISLDDRLEHARRLAETVEDDLEEFAERMLGAFGAREDDVALVVVRREG
ncbi:Serine phosphatase RsbU, regulator of sigma subunit [Nonomuraea solani]|uniref:Serine phosphatase RsbU, regulator of sigma subunit n=1 Tax=Nonomuraea solani TaxID=1144553 RepID=A0A1H6ETL0_9ACTN|nr:fused response regulator/phosphatase [Nonomuraea solani]SEH00024.1 Serine phosphatase RsbU, regulator of sigma subunit [Nonomuraea solani]